MKLQEREWIMLARYACGCQVREVPYTERGETGTKRLANATVIEYCPKHKAAPDMYEALKIANDFLDRQNGVYGNETELCLYCHSKEFGGFGIMHEARCPIQKAREAIAKAEGRDNGKE